MPNVIVITGPCGAGKTTVSQIVTERLKIPHLQGDHVKDELFPEIEDVSQHPKELAAVKAELLRRAKKLFDEGQSVVVDYIVLGDYIRAYQETFGKDLIFKVLLPNVAVTAERDAHRESWTAGAEHVEGLHALFLRDEELIGRENFIDSSELTPEETAERIFACISSI